MDLRGPTSKGMGKGEGEARREEGGDGRKGEDGEGKGVRFFFSADLATLTTVLITKGQVQIQGHYPVHYN